MNFFRTQRMFLVFKCKWI